MTKHKSNTTSGERLAYRTAARIFLDITESVAGEVSSTIECTFIGAYVYMMDMPVTVYNISKLPVCGSYRTTKRYVDLMVEAGAFAYTEEGLVYCTEQGKANSDWFFKKMFEMPANVASMIPETKQTARANKRLSNVFSVAAE